MNGQNSSHTDVPFLLTLYWRGRVNGLKSCPLPQLASAQPANMVSRSVSDITVPYACHWYLRGGCTNFLGFDKGFLTSARYLGAFCQCAWPDTPDTMGCGLSAVFVYMGVVVCEVQPNIGKTSRRQVSNEQPCTEIPSTPCAVTPSCRDKTVCWL